MATSYIANTNLAVRENYICAFSSTTPQVFQVVKHRFWLTILEIFVHQSTVEAAYFKFRLIEQNLNPEPSDQPYRGPDSKNIMICLGRGTLKIKKENHFVDLTAISQETYQVITSVLDDSKFEEEGKVITDFVAFQQTVHHLASLGLLSPAPDAIDWGDFKRKMPMCNIFGFTRGTPIDRYYLNCFIREVRLQVIGSVLEVGGVVANREQYQFTNVSDYQTIDITKKPGVTLVGDVSEQDVIAPGSLDSVVIFNVLEHCPDPWLVVKNIYHWLKPGGKCFCMVPSAQRLHHFPRDYWRLLPDGMQQLFADFTQQNLFVYGNPITVAAGFMGVAAEELSVQELSDHHPHYPVATCIVAVK